MRDCPAVRVAVPLEMCWHEVPGGTARAALDLAAALDARDDVEVIGVAARHPGPPDPVWAPSVPVVHHRLPRLALYETWHGLRRPLVDGRTGPVDLLHVMAGAVAASRRPLVATVNDLAFVHYPELFTGHGRRFFRRALTLIRREAAAVICPSAATRDDCLTAGITADRLHLIPLAVTVSHPERDDIDAVHRRIGIERPYVMAMGTLEPRKNLRTLLEAWRRLDRTDVELVLAGGSGWGDALGPDALPANVRLTGFIDNATRDALYAGSQLTCYPSIFEGFGLPVLEAMALGSPVITSRGTACEELVTGGAGVAVDPHSPDAFAEAIGALLDDDDRRAVLRAAGRDRAATYSWAATAEQVVSVYRSVVGPA